MHQVREVLGVRRPREFPVHIDAVEAVAGEEVHGILDEGSRKGRVGGYGIEGIGIDRSPSSQGQEDLHSLGMGPRHQVDQPVLVIDLGIASVGRRGGEGIADVGKVAIPDGLGIARPGREIAYDLEIGGNPVVRPHHGYIRALTGASRQQQQRGQGARQGRARFPLSDHAIPFFRRARALRRFRRPATVIDHGTMHRSP